MIVSTSLHLFEGIQCQESNPAKQSDCSSCDNKKDVPEIGPIVRQNIF